MVNAPELRFGGLLRDENIAALDNASLVLGLLVGKLLPCPIDFALALKVSQTIDYARRDLR